MELLFSRRVNGVTARQKFGSTWNYFRKYKKNHAKNSLLASPTYQLIPESERADLLPSTPLIGMVTDSPWLTPLCGVSRKILKTRHQ